MSIAERLRKPRQLVLRDPATAKFLDEVRRLESSLQPGAEARRRLPFGCTLLASRNATSTSKTTLQIFLDPLRFRKWSEGLEPIDRLYMNPSGLEVVKHHPSGRWAVYLDEQELLLNLAATEPYEMAALEIRPSISGSREIVRTK